MRRNFAQVLREGKIDIKNEYSKIYDLFYTKDLRDGKSISDIISQSFLDYFFRGTCLTLEEFNTTYDFHFERDPEDFDIDYLINFCEYVFNFVSYLQDAGFFCSFDKNTHITHILTVIEAVGYVRASEDDLTIFVPKDNAAIAVSESKLIPDGMSYKVIAYNHHSKKGDLGSKRQTLIALADLLEPRRSELTIIDRQFTSDLFYAFNNFHIRHNNIDATSSKYKKPIADLSEEQLETVYDEIFQMCLLAFMRLDHKENKDHFDVLKNEIENKK